MFCVKLLGVVDTVLVQNICYIKPGMTVLRKLKR